MRGLVCAISVHYDHEALVTAASSSHVKPQDRIVFGFRYNQTTPKSKLSCLQTSLAMVNTLFLPELREMLASNNTAELKEFCDALHPAATADFMEGLSANEIWAVLKNADRETRSEIFGFFPEPLQIEIINSQKLEGIAELMEDLAPDDRVDLLQELDQELSEKLVQALPTEERRETIRLQAYPEDTAGAVMTTEVAMVGEDLTVSQALKELQAQAQEVETIYYIYIVDDSQHLRGVLSARDLISALSTPDKPISEVMDTKAISVDVHDDQEEVAQKVAHYDLLAIPVVDEQHQMLGIITHDDVIDVVREEAMEDAHRIAGVEPLEDGYLQTAILQLCWNRGVWLAPLFVAALLTAQVIRQFENILDQLVWLTWFIPLIMSSGGNSGNQSATLVITGLTNGNIKLTDWFRVVLREIGMGFLLGGLLGLVFLPISHFFFPSINTWSAIFVVPLTLVAVVVCGTTCGSLLPLIFKRLGQDPALMSNPFVAGIIDIVGIIVYVKVACVLLDIPA